MCILPACMYVLHMCSWCQKYVSHPLKLELQRIVHSQGSKGVLGIEPQSSGRIQALLTTGPTLKPSDDW